MSKFCIYKITNKVNGKLYFGKTSNPRKRWQQHLATVKIGPDEHGRYQYLHRAINKYGVDNFSLEVVGRYESEQEALEEEKYYIAKHNTFNGEGYNLTEGGDGASGYKHTLEAIQKMREFRSHNTYYGRNNPFYGKTHSSECREKLSLAASKRTGDKNPFYGKSRKPG